MNDTSVKGKGEKRFQVIINIILMIFALCAILPFILLLSSSLTDDSVLMQFGYNFWPRKFSAYAYQYLFTSNGGGILRSYGITILVTAIGTVIHLLVGPLLAYPLSRRDYKRAGLVTFLIFFTMLFNGGIVPSYLMWTGVFHVKNT
ncbi:MAG: carbohydrate ABC transporter permease, partial [Bilifractor sp.]|nr:carbohydrate ABC transporter permease [Bilifractor sp.]